MSKTPKTNTPPAEPKPAATPAAATVPVQPTKCAGFPEGSCEAAVTEEEIEAGFTRCEDCEVRKEQADAAAKTAVGDLVLPVKPAESAAGTDEDEPTTDEVVAELRAMGAVLGEAQRDGNLHIITRGGQSLIFPGDEARAVGMNRAQLLGEAIENPATAEGPLVPRGVRELEEMGAVLEKKVYPKTDPGGARTVVITRGGDKLVFPGDEAKAARLTDSRLTGISDKGFPSANLFGKAKKK